MNKPKYITLISIFLLYAFSYAQEDLGTRIMLNTNGVSDASYYVYNPPFLAKAIYSDLNEAKNEFPEQLMSSILSATTQEWVNYNTLGGVEKAEIKTSKDFEEIKTINKEKTFFELLSKLEFKANENEMAIIKFYFHKENKNKPIAGALVFQKVDGIWKKTSTPYTTNMAMALMVFKPDVMNRLLLREAINELEENIINKVYDKDGFNFNKLLEQNFTKEEKEFLTNPLNW